MALPSIIAMAIGEPATSRERQKFAPRFAIFLSNTFGMRCVKRVTRDQVSKEPVQVGNIYCLGRKLGSGSFGEIYYAVDSQSLGLTPA